MTRHGIHAWWQAKTVRLTVLGCSGSVPGPDIPASGYLISDDIDDNPIRLVVDLGNGTLARLQTIVDPFAIDALLFSHLHSDHCADFSVLTVLRRYHPAPPYNTRAHRLPVYGPSDTCGRLTAAYACNAEEIAETKLTEVFEFHQHTTTPVDIAGFTVTATPVDHVCEAYGMRIERGARSIAYTGDTGPCDALDALADGVDTLLAEAAWTDHPSRPTGLHLSGRQAGELAARAGVGRLVVTHVQPWVDASAVLAEAKAAFQGDVVLAAPGAVFEI